MFRQVSAWSVHRKRIHIPRAGNSMQKKRLWSKWIKAYLHDCIDNFRIQEGHACLHTPRHWHAIWPLVVDVMQVVENTTTLAARMQVCSELRATLLSIASMAQCWAGKEVSTLLRAAFLPGVRMALCARIARSHTAWVWDMVHVRDSAGLIQRIIHTYRYMCTYIHTYIHAA